VIVGNVGGYVSLRNIRLENETTWSWRVGFVRAGNGRGGRGFGRYREYVMKPYGITIVKLILELVLVAIRYGNQKIFYHICHPDASFEYPMEVEGVEIRESLSGSRITIW